VEALSLKLPPLNQADKNKKGSIFKQLVA